MNTTAPIVVGGDGSASSDDAVRWAAVAAALRRASVVLVSTYPTPQDVAYATVPLGLFAEQEAEGNRLLVRAAEIAVDAARGHQKVHVRTELLTGPPILMLLDQSHTAGMMVLGSRGLGEFTGGLLGSVSSALAAHADCPVAVIRGLPGPGDAAFDGPVVVGVDGSRNSEPAIAAAFEEASLRGADLVAVHAWTDFNVSTVFKVDSNEMVVAWPGIQTGEEAVLAESMAGWQNQYPDVLVRKVVVRDRPVRHLLAQAELAQLVVVGSRGRGGFPSMLLGSTSQALLHTVGRPLLIVRASA